MPIFPTVRHSALTVPLSVISFVSRAYIIIKTNRFNNKYLTGLLNSKLVAYWLKNKGKIQGDNYQVDKEPILGIPIYVPNSNEDINTAKIVDSITNIINSDDYADNIQKQETVKEYENQIDIMVYKLYNLTYQEVLTIDPNFSMSEKEYNCYQI